MTIEESKQDAGIDRLPSLGDSHRGTHIDLVRLPIDSAVNHDGKPWHNFTACIDSDAAQRQLTKVLTQLQEVPRRVVQIQALTAGWGHWLMTETRQTYAGLKSEELGFGFSYTNAVLIISEDV